MDVLQFSFCGLLAARCSSCATTSTTAIGWGVESGGGTTWAAATGGGVAAGNVVTGGGVAVLAEPMPSFASILPNKLM